MIYYACLLTVIDNYKTLSIFFFIAEIQKYLVLQSLVFGHNFVLELLYLNT